MSTADLLLATRADCTLDELIAQVAQRQDGLVLRRQLRILGLSDDQIDRRLRRGRYERIYPGVYRIAGAPVTYRQRVRAAVMSAGPGAAASHRSGAVLLGVGRLDRDKWLVGEPIDITVRYEVAPVVANVHRHRSLDLTPEQVMTIHDIPVTNPLRLVVDLGAVVPWWTVETVLERLIEQRRITPAAAKAALDQLSRRGRRGCGALRRVLEKRGLGAQISDSRLEAILGNLCRDHGLPPIEFQVWTEALGRRCRIDFAYPDAKLAIEVDGFATHGTREAFGDDRARDVDLAAIGWQTIRFTWNDVVYRPEWVAQRLRAIRRMRLEQLKTSLP